MLLYTLTILMQQEGANLVQDLVPTVPAEEYVGLMRSKGLKGRIHKKVEDPSLRETQGPAASRVGGRRDNKYFYII